MLWEKQRDTNLQALKPSTTSVEDFTRIRQIRSNSHQSHHSQSRNTNRSVGTVTKDGDGKDRAREKKKKKKPHTRSDSMSPKGINLQPLQSVLLIIIKAMHQTVWRSSLTHNSPVLCSPCLTLLQRHGSATAIQRLTSTKCPSPTVDHV